MAPTTQTSWIVKGRDGFDCLSLLQDVPIPEIGENEVLVKLRGASLNYRDLIIPKGQYPFPTAPEVVPASDGAGEVVKVGSKVTRFQTGDKVITLFNQGHLSGSLDHKSIATGLGGALDGTLRQYGSFNESGLVLMPSHLTYPEAASLTCAGVTAWNALYGLESRGLKPGDWVLTQGTGGVSIFALQFAKAAGARVISTTSSAAKAERLRSLGADHVLNYKEDAEWGASARKLTGGRGVQHVVEVGGPTTLRQSFSAVSFDGVISIIGFLGGVKGEKQPTFLDPLMTVSVVRGIYVGSRAQMEDMNRAIEANGIKPVMDERVFKLSEVKQAYEHMQAQQHFGKIAIEID